MVKKLLIGAGSGLLVLTLLFGRDAVSYISTTIGWVRDSVRDQVPVPFELDRAREMIADLTPEVRRNMRLIAREEIAVEQLAEEVADLENRQAKGEVSLKRIQQELASGRNTIRFGATVYTSSEVKELAKTRFERYRTDDLTLRQLRQVLSARQHGLEAARKKLDGMIAAKQQLLAEVANLEARQKMNEVAYAASELSFDDSHLARTRELIQDIESRIQVEERLVDAELEYTDEIMLDESPSSAAENIADEIATYFNVTPESAVLAEVSIDDRH